MVAAPIIDSLRRVHCRLLTEAGALSRNRFYLFIVVIIIIVELIRLANNSARTIIGSPKNFGLKPTDRGSRVIAKEKRGYVKEAKPPGGPSLSYDTRVPTGTLILGSTHGF